MIGLNFPFNNYLNYGKGFTVIKKVLSNKIMHKFTELNLYYFFIDFPLNH